MHLLTETSMFLPLPNDCLCQMTGTPIIHTKLSAEQATLRRHSPAGRPAAKRVRTDDIVSDRPAKRRRLDVETQLGYPCQTVPAVPSIQHVASKQPQVVSEKQLVRSDSGSRSFVQLPPERWA